MVKVTICHRIREQIKRILRDLQREVNIVLKKLPNEYKINNFC